MEKKNSELIKDLNKKYEKGLDNKQDAERNALININYINGKQYIKLDKFNNLVEDIQIEGSPEYKVKESFNRLRSLRNTIVTKIKDKIPVPQVIPFTQGNEDLDIAKATNAMLEDLFNRQKVEKKLKKAAINTVDIGPAFIHVKWDPNAGTVLMSDLDALLGDSSALIPYEEKERLRKKLDSSGKLRSGDVVIENVDMFEMIVANPYEQEIQEQEWIMRIKAYDAEYAKEVFGIDFKTTESVGRITQSQDRGYDNRTLVDNLGIYNSEEIKDQVVIKEYFEKPCAKYPNGRYILFGGDEIIKQGEMPYINGEYETREYPFIKVGLDTPNLFYSHAFIEDMKAIQKRYNQIRNRKYEYIVKSVHGQLAVEEGSLADDVQLTNKPGTPIFYKRGFAPPQSLKSANSGALDVDSELRSLESEFTNVSGISSLSTAGTPNSSAVRGAGMVQMLLESDDSKFTLIIDTLVDAVIDISKQAIRLYKQFMMEGEVRFTRFTKDLSTAIHWNSNLLVEDITIKNRAKLSMTDARRKEQVQMLLQSGLLSKETGISPDMRIKLIEEMDLGISLNEMPIEGYSDIKKARRENYLIVNDGAEISASNFDDHQIHYDIHTNYIKSDEYRRIIIANPMIDKLMTDHIKQHSDVLDARNKQAMAEAMAQENNKNK